MVDPCCVLPVEEGAPMGPLWCSSHRRRCTHGSHELSTGWSTHGSMLHPSNGRGSTHGSQGPSKGWSTYGSTLLSIPWKREHPWLHSGVLPMEEGAPMGPKEQTSVGASVMALCWFPSHGRVHPWVPRAEHRVEHQWIHTAVHPMEEEAPMGPL